MLSNAELQGQPVKLTEEDIAVLTHIYQVRLRTFIVTYLFLIIIGVQAGLSIDKGNYRYSRRETGLSRTQMYTLSIALLEAFVMGTGIIIFRKRIGCLKKDIKGGVKECIYYSVIQKPRFENTGQYFVGLNHPDYLFHEVSAETWHQVNIGDDFVVYRAPKSKYVFNNKKKYTVM